MNTHQHALQAATLETARHNGDDWTSRDDAHLINLRQHGFTIADCATRLDRTYYAVSTRIQLLGLSQPRTVTQTHAGPTACTACWLVHTAECR